MLKVRKKERKRNPQLLEEIYLLFKIDITPQAKSIPISLIY